MNQTTRRVFGVAGFALLLATSASFAQQPAPVRVRGTVEAVDGPLLTVKSRDGQTTYKVKLTDNAAVRGIVKAPLSDIKDNSFIVVTGMLGGHVQQRVQLGTGHVDQSAADAHDGMAPGVGFTMFPI